MFIRVLLIDEIVFNGRYHFVHIFQQIFYILQ